MNDWQAIIRLSIKIGVIVVDRDDVMMVKEISSNRRVICRKSVGA